MFYVSKNNTLRCRQFDAGVWGSPDDFGGSDYFPDPSAYTVAEDSRHLSVGVYARPNSTLLFMLYQSSFSGVTLLKCDYKLNGTIDFWKWRNFSTSLFHESQRLQYNLSVPFTLISRNDTKNIDMLFATEKNGEYPGSFIRAIVEGSEIGQLRCIFFLDELTNDYRSRPR